jgi:hypothetical protein
MSNPLYSFGYTLKDKREGKLWPPKQLFIRLYSTLQIWTATIMQSIT